MILCQKDKDVLDYEVILSGRIPGTRETPHSYTPASFDAFVSSSWEKIFFDLHLKDPIKINMLGEIKLKDNQTLEVIKKDGV
ncbi:MAG: hypothetical protein NTY93_02185, partial [Candidatus Kaiserbacteria bacterium]|nr:hypothetical protein [Candidatus Kaiserbacteria bacterium]